MIDPASSHPAFIDPSIDSRAVTFENPTGARGAGGSTYGGRKGAPSARIPGETVVLADLEGPGIIRHIWITIPPAPPEQMRAVSLEVYYDGASEPSISVPALDFFGLPHGRPVPYHSTLTAVNEGRGFNSFVPMPFGRRVRVELTNHHAERGLRLYYQIDVTLHAELPAGLGYLHADFRRDNPTEMRRDFVIVDGLRGPGRFLGCVVGVRVLDEGVWYGEGELKIYRDGDTDLPTICGTGLEDYVLSAWGLGAHETPYAGAPLVVGTNPEQPDFVGFYRWHVPDPIMFERELRVTIQQIGAMFFGAGDDATREAYEANHPVAGEGWVEGRGVTWGIAERVDDYCATAFVYCTEPQPVRRLDMAAALADIERLPYEQPHPMEYTAAIVEPDPTTVS